MANEQSPQSGGSTRSTQGPISYDRGGGVSDHSLTHEHQVPHRGTNPNPFTNKFRNDVYEEMCHIGINGESAPELGWFYIVSERINARVMPVDLDEYNEILKKAGLDEVDEEWTLFPVTPENIFDRRDTGFRKKTHGGSSIPNEVVNLIRAIRNQGQPQNREQRKSRFPVPPALGGPPQEDEESTPVSSNPTIQEVDRLAKPPQK